MNHAYLPLLALALGCSTAVEPAATDPVIEPSAQGPAPEARGPAPEAQGPAPRPTVSVPSVPALFSFTGQGTHLGMGLWCAFYPLGWSDDGRFAWATEHRGNDMALEYGAIWQVLQVGSDAEVPFVAFGGETFPDNATLPWAWSQHSTAVEALLKDHFIMAGGTELLSLPAETMVGRLEARWELGEVVDFERSAHLLIRWDGGEEAAVYEGALSELVGAPDAPKLILSPSGQHAVLVYSVVHGEPVEALVDLQYRVHGLQLGPT